MTPVARGTLVALSGAAAGAAVQGWAGVPAGILIGATLAVTLLAAVGARPVLPAALRNLAFGVIGLTLGSGIGPDILQDMARWPLSLVGMVAALGLTMAGSVLLLRRIFGMEGATALLATSPGALSYALALAGEGRADLRAVMLLQSTRLLAVTVLVAPVVGLAMVPQGEAAPAVPPMGPAASLGLLAGGAALAPLLARAGVPAAWLIGGLVVSGIAHVSGIVEGRPDPRLTVTGFVVAGGAIGARFAGLSRGEVRRLSAAALATSLLALVASFLLSWPIAVWLDLSHAQVWLAYVPGGVEAMAAIAISLDQDPAYVATHHVIRLLLLFAILPWLVRWVRRA